jgi:ADP-heptose:LPS heptosyltransferase
VRRLLIRPGAIGDCILSLPALEHLVADYTEVWVPSPVIPLIQFAGVTRSILSTGLDLVGIPDREISGELHAKLQSFDSIVSWYGSTRPEFRRALLSINPNCEFHRALPPADYDGHATDFFAAQVGASPGLIPRIPVSAQERRNAIVIHPFSGSQKKNWPLDQYRELSKQLPYEVTWLAGPEEELPEAQRFENLADLAAYIASARLYIGNDSGITHLAAAVGVKTIALFGPKSPRIWVPRGDNVEVVAVSDLADLKPSFLARIARRPL